MLRTFCESVRCLGRDGDPVPPKVAVHLLQTPKGAIVALCWNCAQTDNLTVYTGGN